MEKRRFRMGVNNNGFYTKINTSLKPKLFIETQLCWGHKKSALNPAINNHILGFVNDFSVFNIEHSTEYLRRSILFCCKAIISEEKNNFVFLSPRGDYRKMMFYFACRSLQTIYYDKWIHGFLTKNYIKSSLGLITPKIDKNLVSEIYKQPTPLICIEDSNYKVNRAPYSFFGNDDSRKSVFQFYKVLTSSLIKSFLYSYYLKCKTIKNK
uniref:Ribosomal protein S2 n=1 Tax=Guillardia theta TaxID=55529 RepID=A0A481WAU9_GUITH|nr:ribosomal protein S2 [Guillardia theta]QBJ06314.1 ribosomal protein S2 [Guillardia theta]